MLTLQTSLKNYLKPLVINGIKIPETYLQFLQTCCLESFSGYKIRITQRLVVDVCDEEEMCRIIGEEHSRAHRNAKEMKIQILERFYLPKMASRIKTQVSSCQVCKMFKYDRHPNKPELQLTPIPTYPCEILHIDLFTLENHKFLSCIDKFSKFAKLFPIDSKSSIHLRENLIEVLHYFTAPKTLVSDNERGLLCPTVLNYLQSLGIEVYYTPSQKSEVNGQVERFHSTFLEIYRCLKNDNLSLKVMELVFIAVDRYNNSVHSVTNRKPVDIFFDRTSRINYQGLTNFKEQTQEDIRGLLEYRQKMSTDRFNKTRARPNTYRPGDTIFVSNKQIKGKDKHRFKKEEVKEDGRVTVKTETGKLLHKSHIKS